MSLGPSLTPAAPLTIGANPLSGAAFGFEVPQGDPGAIQSAARACRELGQAIALQTRALRAAATVALDTDGSWRGSAASAYADYTGHVSTIGAGNGHGCEQAASALQTLAQELTEAQSITRQALADCEQTQTEMTRQQGLASTAGQQAQTAETGEAGAVHPATRTAFKQQADTARQQQADAQRAAGIAEQGLQAAQRRGQLAAERYAHVAQAANNRLMSAAQAMRAPAMPADGAPVPVSVTPNDVSLAGAIVQGTRNLAATGDALGDPAKLPGVACGPVTAGTIVQLLKDYDEGRQMEQIAASDKPLDGSLAGVVPGLSEAETQGEQFVDGAWDATKGTVSAFAHPGQLINALLGTNPAYREIVDHEDPITAQADAQRQGEQLLANAVDVNDFAHGRIAEGLGNLTASALEAKGGGELLGAADRAAQVSLGARGELTKAAMNYAGYAGVPHAGDLSDVAGSLASHSRTELAAGTHVIPAQALAAVGGLSGADRLSAQIVDAASALPSDPKVIVVTPRTEPAYRAPSVPVRAVVPRGAPRGR